VTSTEPHAAFTCTRWTRYGHDRLYVTSVDGQKIGHRDLKTGFDHPLAEGDRTLVARVADGWQAVQGGVRGPAAVPDTPAELVQPRPWVDLSLNRPGAQAREVAVAKRAEAPVRTTIARLFGVRNDERAWRIGADGEELVAGQLSVLARKNPAWTAIHAVPVGSRGADIDHLVLGPGGVFTINTKHHPGADVWAGGETLLVNGARTHHVRNARFEAERASRLLSAAVGRPVLVHGLVVTVNAKSVTVKKPPAPGVTVLYRKQLAHWLGRLGPVLDQDALNCIWDCARRSTTWEC
jgi:hypothetical protein